MNLRFEKWYKQQSLPDDVIELFDEAVLCFKVSAYRASFLMTYLGLQTILKERLLKANRRPDKINESHWNLIRKKLKDDNCWDREVNEIVKKQNPDNIFLINDDLRQKYLYWRSIRNDCAHDKNNHISYPHTESLWLFIESNLAKFVVNGGKEGLYEKIKEHYDVRYTAPNTDPSNIINEIINAMDAEEIPKFLTHVYENLVFDVFYLSESNNGIDEFWRKIANHYNPLLRNSFIEFIKSDWKTFNEIIIICPNKVLEIHNNDQQFIRIFWNDKIFDMLNHYNRGVWEVIEIMLTNNIIPQDEKKFFIKKISRAEDKDDNLILPPDEYADILKQNGYYKHIKRKYLKPTLKQENIEGGVLADNCWNIIKQYIMFNEIDDIVILLNEIYNSATHGKFYDGMNSFFEKNKDFRNKYISIANKEGLILPKVLQDTNEKK